MNPTFPHRDANSSLLASHDTHGLLYETAAFGDIPSQAEARTGALIVAIVLILLAVAAKFF